MAPGFTKPAELFDRDVEWSELSAFASNPALGASLGLMYGRRRQGKTMLLELLAEVSGGFYFTGLQQSSKLNLGRLSQAYGAFTGRSDVPVQFQSWEQALGALLALGQDAPVPIILDEFGYLMEKEPALPSVLQALLSPRGAARTATRGRLLICGSAISVMKALLAGPAPLRGRATLEMLVHPFGYRDAAAYWGLDGQWEAAFKMHALVGGTPAYRDFAGGDVPDSSSDIERWVPATLLNPSSAFFREGRILLEEESEISDDALYWSVLTAIADGNTRRGQIASMIGRPNTALGHPLTVLTDTQLITKHEDALKLKRATFHIAEPILRFRQLIIEPNENRLTRRRGQQVWEQSTDTVSSRIYGPHFEQLAREWTQDASADTLGGQVGRVGSSVIDCAACTQTHEIDVVALAKNPHSAERVIAIGEAKWRATPVGIAELNRLTHIGDVVTRAHASAAHLQVLLFSGGGFTPDLRQAATASDGRVQLVDLGRLYTGN
ncbi:MAG: DUF234 domain-containing protein [Actinomycetes bacterium]